MSYFHSALEQAWKIHSVLPHKALTKTDGTVQCPLSVYTDGPVSVSSFRVMFCPVVMTYDHVNTTKSNARTETIETNANTPRTTSLNRKNNPQRGMRGIHVGLPRHSTGYLVYVPSTGKIYNSVDVYFDEDFNSTLTYENNQFSGYLDVTITDPMPDTDLPTYHTGSPLEFARYESPGKVQFAKASVDEMFDEDVALPNEESSVLEEIQRYRKNDNTIDLYTKFVQDP
jgi:hypothetical protein